MNATAANDPMDDIVERDVVAEDIPIAQCRDLLGDEALELSDEDIEAIRRHAHAMAPALIESFLTNDHRA